MTPLLNDLLKPRAPLHRSLWGIVVMSGLVTVTLAVHSYQLESVRASEVARIEELQRARVPAPQRKVVRAEEEVKKQWLNLRAERDFDWLPLFQAIERSNSNQIELLEFRPDKHSRTVTLRGEARDSAALIAYLEKLAMQGELSKVHLIKQESLVREQFRTVGFELKATLRF